MKQADMYDSTFTTSRYDRRDIVRPAITAGRARAILAAARTWMDPGCMSKINPSLTNEQAFGILAAAVTEEMLESHVLHSLVSRNIVKTFGRFYASGTDADMRRAFLPNKHGEYA